MSLRCSVQDPIYQFMQHKQPPATEFIRKSAIRMQPTNFDHRLSLDHIAKTYKKKLMSEKFSKFVFLYGHELRFMVPKSRKFGRSNDFDDDTEKVEKKNTKHHLY